MDDILVVAEVEVRLRARLVEEGQRLDSRRTRSVDRDTGADYHKIGASELLPIVLCEVRDACLQEVLKGGAQHEVRDLYPRVRELRDDIEARDAHLLLRVVQDRRDHWR